MVSTSLSVKDQIANISVVRVIFSLSQLYDCRCSVKAAIENT